ncbi:type VI secretion system Vgr family protein [Desulfovibrio gilichinskyi]|uniref:Type VI secretion system secreted protein VgrG n=1 Tax=Desulfovibrio gilichinskyi TaxID=1519643 RepID=A0A1X7D5W7_9BACT|nr:type VI secretion system tip protein TssI/VgrG [Desulfovibrio gilichinskyi]SMF09457.1 type VI secretion system secreted protein VgrG [Desulfovibrio gilichinskyi]
MAENTKPKFTFESKAVDKNTFNVVNFKGTEGISTIYRFNILLISEKTDLDLGAILQNGAEFTIKRDDGDISFNGVLSSFEQMHQAAGMVFYRAELVPHLWRTTLTHCNEIFLNKNVQDILAQALQKGGLKQGLNFDFKLQGSYPSREYVCQYDESYFNFVSRWMERDGMYYYFEQTDQGEKMIITDTHISHSPMSEGTSLSYSPPSNLDHARREEIVKNFMLKQQPLPKKVLLKDYNYLKPSLEMKAEAMVSQQGLGEIYIYGDHFKTISEGQTLAKIRAEEFLCREKLFHGVSTVPYIRTGYIFEMKDHYRQDFNQRYLTTDVVHEGSQEAYLVSGLGLHLAGDEDRLYYRNSFTCIPANTQFRAERKAAKPKFSGTMNAKIDASGSGKYAELDSHGRYKVILPFDESGRSQGKATTWLRMAQPYGGSNHGMHFPLHKGTEVLLTCIDGDPDRPIIQAAVPNPETPSLVTDNNQTKCMITTGGQNRIHMEDQSGSERILMHTPKSNTWIRMGTPNDPPAAGDGDGDGDGGDEPKKGWSRENEGGEDGYKLNTSAHMSVFAGSSASTILGNEFKFIGGSSEEVIVGNDTKVFIGFKEDVVAGLETGLSIGGEIKFAPFHTVIHEAKSKLEGEVEHLQGEVTKMSGSVTKLAGEKTVMDGELSTLRGEHNTLVAEHNKLAGSTQKLAGESSKLAGQVDKVWGEMNTVAGCLTNLCGEVTELSGDKSSIVGVMSKAIGETTKSIGEQSTVVGQTNEVAGEMNKIAGLITMV